MGAAKLPPDTSVRTASTSLEARRPGPRAPGTRWPVRFIKAHGLGNDYVYIEAFTQPRIAALGTDDLARLSRRVSDRHTGVGSDGLILILPADAGVSADARMRMFNADGSEAQMCGNGIRAVAKIVCERLRDFVPVRDEDRGANRLLRIGTGAGLLTIACRMDQDEGEPVMRSATVNMGRPTLDAARVPTALRDDGGTGRAVGVAWHTEPHLRSVLEPLAASAEVGLEPTVTCVSMGNPHAVLFCGDIDAVPLERVGPMLERASCFPERCNIHFVQVGEGGGGSAIMRTWERGSGITRACGTGACAVLVAGVLTGRLLRQATITLPGGDLSIVWDERTDEVLMTGPAEISFDGVILI